MKTIITLLLCISIATAQQIPTVIKSKYNNKLEFQTIIAQWREKLKQFNTPELRKSQKYAELIGMPTKHVTQVDILQQHKPSLTIASDKVTGSTKCYDIPFPEGTSASKGNVIELSVANSSAMTADGIKVEVTSSPEWLKFDEKSIALEQLNANEEKVVSFVFAVEKTTEVKKEQTLRFTISDKIGNTWKKEIKIQVAPPTTYELFQNYPNPFNPTTTIEYQLPDVGTRFMVSLKVYDMLGREVAELVKEQQEPGGHQLTFDARKFASGMYVYRLIATDDQNNHHIFQNKMLMVK